MPALAAIVNRAVPDDKSILLFYNTSKAQLGLSLHSGTKDDEAGDGLWAAGDNDYNGYIMNPSFMSSAFFRGMSFVVAVTSPQHDKDSPGSVNQISLVSPVYQRLTTSTPENTSVAMCSSGDEGWVYFTSRLTQTTRTIQELNLTTFGTASLAGTHDAWINTALAAWYDPVNKQRHVVYEGSSLMEYTVESQRVEFVGGVGNMLRNTPLAVSYFNGKVYLYYCGRGDEGVQRIIKDGGRWGAASKVNGAPVAAESSQLTVVAANGFNHLFFVAAGDENTQTGPVAAKYFTHVRDPIV